MRQRRHYKSGGNAWDAMKAGVVGGLIGGASGFLSFAAGGVAGNSPGAILERMGRHAFVNMWMSGIQGNFDNMWSAALTGAASSAGGAGLTALNTENTTILTAANAVIGGTVSMIGGGKFANGAVTGAFTMLYNELKHSLTEAKLKKIYESYPKAPSLFGLLGTTKNELFEMIGGPLSDWYNTDPEALQNTCAIRLSYALNHSGFTIPNVDGTYKGANGANYFVKVGKMANYLIETFGTPKLLSPNSTIKSGIIWQSNCGWRDATGHLDIMYKGSAGSEFYNQCGTVKYWK